MKAEQRLKKPHWKLIFSDQPLEAEAAISEDERWLGEFASLNEHSVLRVWHCNQSLIATPKESRMDGFKQAQQTLGRAGWPIHVRRTGGSCVPQGPGVLNFSMIYGDKDGLDIEDSYLLLCKPLLAFLSQLGLSAGYGSVPGSFCDGRYNLQIQGRKVVGTAQRRRKDAKTGTCYILAHACILVDLDLAEATGKINELYRLGGSSTRFEEQACTTLVDALSKQNSSAPAPGFVDIQKIFVQSLQQLFPASPPGNAP